MVEVIKVDAEVMIIKGLMSAEESRKKAEFAIAERERAFKEAKEVALKKLMEKDFVKKVLERTISSINSAVARVERQICESGWGNTAHPLRCWEETEKNAIMELITKQIIPILESQGYKCKADWSYFTQGIYFSIDVFW